MSNGGRLLLCAFLLIAAVFSGCLDGADDPDPDADGRDGHEDMVHDDDEDEDNGEGEGEGEGENETEPEYRAPRAFFEILNDTVHVGSEIFFDASDSVDPEQGELSYEWDFGDGNSSTGLEVSHTYTLTGSYNVTLNITSDVSGLSANATEELIVKEEPFPEFEYSESGQLDGLCPLGMIASIFLNALSDYETYCGTPFSHTQHEVSGHPPLEEGFLVFRLEPENEQNTLFMAVFDDDGDRVANGGNACTAATGAVDSGDVEVTVNLGTPANRADAYTVVIGACTDQIGYDLSVELTENL